MFATTNPIARIAAVVAGASLVAMSFAVFAPSAKADALSDLQAQVNALLAQIAALQGGSASASATFTMDLHLGSSGADVTALQNWLIGKGYAIAAGATGFYGAQTQAALAKFQAANGISPAAGFFGPVTRAKVNAMAGGSSSSNNGNVSGLQGAGRLTNVSSLGDTTSDIKEGDAETKVVGVSAEATGGDVLIQRVDAVFQIGASGSQSSNLNKYVSSVDLYIDGDKVASMDPASGDKNTRQWTFRFAGLNKVVKSGKTVNIYVEVRPISSVGTNETGKTVTAELFANALRAAGADGISETYISGTSGADSSSYSSAFTVSSSNVGTLTVAAASDNPRASQIAVASSTTTGVTLLKFTLKAKNQDVSVADLVASFGTSDNNLNDVVSNVKLMKGSTVLSSKTLSTGTYGTVTFDNINEDISKDATNSYSIVADLKGDSAYADGTTLIASTTTAGWDVTDANGASVTPSAAAIGYTQTLTATGISVTKGSISTQTSVGLTGAGDITQYVIPFTVTAGDTDVFIGGSSTRLASVSTTPSASAGGVNYATTTTSTSGATGMPTATFGPSDTVSGDVAGSAYKVSANTSRTFTFTVALTATTTGSTTAGFTGVQLVGINYGPTSTLSTTYYTSNLDTFKSNDVYMTKR